MCYPGDGIPDWFSHQNEGYSVNMKISPYWCHRSTINFAVCVVVEREDNGVSVDLNDHNDVVISEGVIRVKSYFGEGRLVFDVCRSGKIINSNHLIMAYYYADQVCFPGAIEMSFEFCIEDYDGNPPLIFRVKRCGIHMISRWEAVQVGFFTREFLIGVSNAKIDEPYPKRTKF